VRNLITRLLVLGLVWLLTPGLAEATENLWHLATEGHSAHAPGAEDDHAPVGDEHGCSGTFHVCSCHASPAMSLIGTTSVQQLSVAGDRRSRIHPSFAGPDLPGLFRPPKA
jgi:hypothetical protein